MVSAVTQHGLCKYNRVKHFAVHIIHAALLWIWSASFLHLSTPRRRAERAKTARLTPHQRGAWQYDGTDHRTKIKLTEWCTHFAQISARPCCYAPKTFQAIGACGGLDVNQTRPLEFKNRLVPTEQLLQLSIYKS